MFYQPQAIVTALDKRVVSKIITGGERVLYASNQLTKRIGELFLAGDGSGVYTPNPIWGSADLTANPSDLQIVSSDGFKSDAAAVFTIVGVGSDSVLLSGTATFAPPSWSKNPNFDFEKGIAFDVTPSRAFTFKSITSVSVTNAKKGATFRLIAAPSAASWVEIDKIEGVGVSIGTRPGVAIPEKLEESDEITAGRAPAQTLSINGHNRGVADGLQRYAGQFCSLRVDIKSHQKILKETQVYGNAFLSVNPNYGSGSDLSTQAAEGMYEDLMVLFAG
jgi:hypothetical protein